MLETDLSLTDCDIDYNLKHLTGFAIEGNIQAFLYVVRIYLFLFQRNGETYRIVLSIYLPGALMLSVNRSISDLGVKFTLSLKNGRIINELLIGSLLPAVLSTFYYKFVWDVGMMLASMDVRGRLG